MSKFSAAMSNLTISAVSLPLPTELIQSVAWFLDDRSLRRFAAINRRTAEHCSDLRKTSVGFDSYNDLFTFLNSAERFPKIKSLDLYFVMTARHPRYVEFQAKVISNTGQLPRLRNIGIHTSLNSLCVLLPAILTTSGPVTSLRQLTAEQTMSCLVRSFDMLAIVCGLCSLGPTASNILIEIQFMESLVISMGISSQGLSAMPGQS